MSLSQLGVEAYQTFVAALSQRVARKTLLNVLGTLSTMLKTARKWGYTCQPLQLSELVIPQEKDKDAQRFFSAEEVKRIIAEVREPFSTMFATLGMTGIRAGELLGLEVEDLDFERRLIFIRRSAWRGRLQTTKSKASKAALPMPEPLAAILREYLETWRPNPMRLLFMNRRGRAFNANKVRTLGLHPVLERLGIPRCGLHAFRHTHSSLLLDVGAPSTVAQAQLRHSDARITLGIYGHVVGDSQRNAVEKVAQLLRPDAPKSAESSEWIQ
jgi:integrase